MLISYEYLKLFWGMPKLARLSHMDNPQDEFALKERVQLAIDTVQNQLLGAFSLTEEEAPEDIKTYIKGILPTFIEYELNPTEALAEKIKMIMDAIKNMNDLRLKKLKIESEGAQDGDYYPQFGMFVV